MGLLFWIPFFLALAAINNGYKKKSKKIICATIIIEAIIIVITMIKSYCSYRYPSFSFNHVLLFILYYSIPSITYFIFYKVNNKIIETLMKFINAFSWVILCFGFFFTFLFPSLFFISETTDINNYLKFDDGYGDVKYFPQDLEDNDMKPISYYYNYVKNFDVRYEVYLEVKIDDKKFQEIYDEMYTESRLIMCNSKEYYITRENNYIGDSRTNLNLIIFDKNNSIITYHKIYSEYKYNKPPHNFDNKTYKELKENLYKYYLNHAHIGEEKLKEHGDVVMSIESKNMSCTPVMLVLYDDNQYELFTYYKSCRPGKVCTDEMVYTKSIHGTYKTNILKILQEDNIEINKSHTMDDLPEYEIYMGDSYVKKGYEYYYSISKGTTNKTLNDLLNNLGLDLKKCANPDYDYIGD